MSSAGPVHVKKLRVLDEHDITGKRKVYVTVYYCSMSDWVPRTGTVLNFAESTLNCCPLQIAVVFTWFLQLGNLKFNESLRCTFI